MGDADGMWGRMATYATYEAPSTPEQQPHESGEEEYDEAYDDADAAADAGAGADKAATLDAVAMLLARVGATVSSASLHERAQATCEGVPRVLRDFVALLGRQPRRFRMRPAPWSSKALLVELSAGAARRCLPQRLQREPRDAAADAAYAAQLSAYLREWNSATMGTLGLDNPPPAAVAGSTAEFVLARLATFSVVPHVAGQLRVRCATKGAHQAAESGPEAESRREPRRQRGSFSA